MFSSVVDVSPETVTSYLQDNQDFLDKYISQHISPEQLEKWLLKKTNHKQQRLKNGETAAGGLKGK